MDKRLQAATQLRRALQMFADTLTDARAMEVATLYPIWEPDAKYEAKQVLSYGLTAAGEPQLYRVAQRHTSQAEWTPDKTPALYTAFTMVGDYPIWQQPTGAHDAYNVGDIVSHNGQLYKSLINGNTTEPGSDPRWWEEFTPERPEVSKE